MQLHSIRLRWRKRLGGASRLVSKIGAARAKEMVFFTDIEDCEDACRLGPVYPDADVEAEARAYAHELAARSDERLSLRQSAHQHRVSNGVSATRSADRSVCARANISRQARRGAVLYISLDQHMRLTRWFAPT